MNRKSNLVSDIIEEIKPKKENLLPILLAVQDVSLQNYVSEEDVNEIARILNLSRSRVYSTASFYSAISLKPRGRHVIRVCVNAPCENEGKQAVLEVLKAELGITLGETSADKMFTLEGVSCLGACYMSPAMKIGHDLYGNLNPEMIVSIIRQYKAGGVSNEHIAQSK